MDCLTCNGPRYDFLNKKNPIVVALQREIIVTASYALSMHSVEISRLAATLLQYLI
jgi:hypothetical protein